MNRRRFVVSSLAVALATSLGAGPHASERSRRIGVLASGFASQHVPGGSEAHVDAALEDGLRDFGYVPGQSVVIDHRYAEGDARAIPGLADELTHQGVEALVAIGPTALTAAQRATTITPIVAIDLETDPVAAGFARSLARPSGNVTGVFLDQADISGKWLQLVAELLPKLARVTVIHDVTTPAHQLRALQAAAKALKLEVRTIDVRSLEDFEPAVAEAGKGRAQAVVLLSSPMVSRHGRRLAELTAAKRLPTISMFKENAVEGCLMAYGPTLVEMYRIAGHLAGRLLNGAKPGELPIERPTRLEFVLNLKTARMLGLTIPSSLLLRADQVIQ